MMTAAPPLLALTITTSSKSYRSSRSFSSPFERFKYFGGSICAISLLISLFAAFRNVSVVWWFFWGIHVLSVGFLNISSSVFGLFVWSLKCPLSLVL